MATKVLELLHEVPLFHDLSRRDLRKVADIGREMEFPAGRIVVSEGAVATDFYLLLSGRTTVSQRGQTLRHLGPGDFFGEIAVLDGGVRSATVAADTPLVVFRLNRQAFFRLLGKEGTIAARLLGEMARRLRAVERMKVRF